MHNRKESCDARGTQLGGHDFGLAETGSAEQFVDIEAVFNLDSIVGIG